MRIVVCIKQVPEVGEVKFDSETKTIVREGVPNVVNPFDRRALAEAIRLREQNGGEVIVVTMGPPQAREALVECLGAGADRALHLVDRAFAGADTLATARALAMALQRESYDLILCGKYSVDAETAQVGPELAELLDIPQVTGATRLELSQDCGRARVERETDDGFETIECELPVLLTASERLIRPIKVKEPQLELGRLRPIREISAAELCSDTRIFGLTGSPTWVTEIRSLARTRIVEMIDGETSVEKACRLVERLVERGALSDRRNDGHRGLRSIRTSELATRREVWAVAELAEGILRNVSFELLGKGAELAAMLRGRVAAFVAGDKVAHHAAALAACGAERVYLAEGAHLDRYTTAAYTDLFVRAIQAYNPVAVLLPSTANGRDLAPRIAARLGVGLTADCIDLEIGESDELVQHKPAFGGNMVALIRSRTLPQIATVKPGMLSSLAPDYGRVAEIVRTPVPRYTDSRARLVSYRREVSADVMELEEAERVVTVGMGIGDPENLVTFQELARLLGASLGATRRVVDAGWLPRHHQIGLTGKIVSPLLYLAVGVRGNLNHTIGIQQSGTIVGINTDPSAEIFQTADFGVIGDWSEIVPALMEALKKPAADLQP